MSMNKKWTKIRSSGKFNLKVQCLIENLYTRESESKSYFWWIILKHSGWRTTLNFSQKYFVVLWQLLHHYWLSTTPLLITSTNPVTIVIITYVRALYNWLSRSWETIRKLCRSFVTVIISIDNVPPEAHKIKFFPPTNFSW